MGAAFTEPSPAVSSLGSWADECERADTALAAAEAQMGQGCPEESLEGDTALTGDLLEEENWEWLTARSSSSGSRGGEVLPPLKQGGRLWPPPLEGQNSRG